MSLELRQVTKQVEADVHIHPTDLVLDPSGSFLGGEGHLTGDHGSPIWPVMYVYHNTFLRETPVFRDYYLFGLGAQGLRHNERDVFNNIFVQADRVPGVNFGGMKEAARVREYVQEGIEQANRGEVAPWNSDRIKAAGRQLKQDRTG